MKKIIAFLFVFKFVTLSAQVSDFNDIDFTRADNIAKLNEGESLKNLPLLCYKLTFRLESKVEKFRAIYTWVSTNIKGDNSMSNKVTRKRKSYKNDSLSLLKWNKSYKKKVFKTLVNRKKTMCTGYAYLIKEMAAIVDIECKIIDGYGRNTNANTNKLEMANHSWNAVKLNNKWYVCDATWSSGYMDGKGYFIKDYNDGYFLTDPQLFSNNHFPLDKKWLLKSKKTTTNFIEAPLIYDEIFKHKAFPVYPETMNVNTTKGKAILFKLKSLNNISSKKISLVLFRDSKQNQFDIYDIKKTKNQISFKYKFKWRGFYDVHLKINNDIVATYSIKVGK